MKQIKYIFVNETGSENAVRALLNSRVSDLRHCVICDAGSKWQVQGSKSRDKLLENLVRLRRHNPDAKILGVSEIDAFSPHAPIRVSNSMNDLRRELSDYP